MEKYRKFADEGTGINPFLPLPILVPPVRRSLLVNGLRFCGGAVLLLIRYPLFLAVLFLLGMSDLLSYIPIVWPLLVRPLLRPLLCWIALFTLGLWVKWIPSVEDFRRLKVRRPTSELTPARMYVTTFHGFVDVLVHAVVSRPTCFVFPCLSGSQVLCSTVLGAMYISTQCPLNKPLMTAEAAANHLSKESLLFISESPTNGEGILKINPDLVKAVQPDYQLCKIDYKAKKFGAAPQHLVGSVFSHIAQLLYRNLCLISVEVFVLPEPLSNTDQLLVMISRLSPACPLTSVDSRLYLEFRSYWNETQGLSYGNRSKTN